MRLVDDSSVEHLLIIACLAPDENFEAAFRAFDSQSSLDGLNEGAIRLIPYLYRRLLTAGIQSPRLPILKGIYARFWYIENMYRVKGPGMCMSTLEGVPYLVLKGQALQRLVYAGDLATRPGDDTDILVRVEDRDRALDRFLKAGFVMKQRRWRRDLLALHPSVGLTREGVDVDLHWDIRPPVENVNVPAVLLRDAQPINFGETRAQTASVNHHLAHTLVHGAAHNEVSPIRWVLDASRLLKHPDLRWSVFWDDARELGWSDVVERQMVVLRDSYKVEIPATGPTNHSNAVSVRQQAVHAAHRATGGYLKKTLASLLITRPAQYRSIRNAEGRSSILSLAIVIGLTFVGELYRRLRRGP